MILDVQAYTVMADIYVRVRLIPSLGEGVLADTKIIHEGTYAPDGRMPPADALCHVARRALLEAIISRDGAAGEPPF